MKEHSFKIFLCLSSSSKHPKKVRLQLFLLLATSYSAFGIPLVLHIQVFRGKVNAHWSINPTLEALRGFVQRAREPGARVDKSTSTRRTIERELQHKCVKGPLQGFGCNTKLLLESSLAEGRRLLRRISCVLHQKMRGQGLE